MSSVNLGRVVGYSAYEIAVQNGFIGTEAEWLASLKGETGPEGPAGTYTAGTGIDITNNVISATGGGGSGLDEDDIKNIYGMSIDNTMEDDQQEAGYNLIWEASIPVSFGELTDSYVSINAGSYEELVYHQLPYVNGIISELVCDSTTIIDEPTEVRFNFLGGGGPSDAIEAAYTYAVGNYTVFMMIMVNADLGEAKMAQISAWGAESGSIAMKLFHPNFTSLATGLLPQQVAYVGQLYTNNKLVDAIADIYGAKPEESEYVHIESNVATYESGVTQYIVSSDNPFVENETINLEGDGHSWHYDWDDTEFVWKYDDGEHQYTIAEDRGDYEVNIPDTLEADFWLSQDYEAVVDAIPFADEFTPQGVLDDIDTLYSNVDILTGDIADIRQVPTYSLADAGKVLSVNSLGDDIEWAAAGGGGSSYQAGNGLTITNDKLISYTGGNITQSIIYATGDAGTYSSGVETSLTFGEANKTAQSEIWMKVVIDGKVCYGQLYKDIAAGTSGRVYYYPKEGTWRGNVQLANVSMYLTNNKYVQSGIYPTITFNANYNVDEIVISRYLTVNPMDASYIPIDNDTIKLTIGAIDGTTQLKANTPSCPTTTNGTYVLKATVSYGTVTYSWVAES